METKHTPGPWTFEPHPREPIISKASILGDLIIARCPKQDGEEQANARLISSAPDLLEACKLALEFLKEGNSTIEDVAYYSVIDAIAKTDGK